MSAFGDELPAELLSTLPLSIVIQGHKPAVLLTRSLGESLKSFRDHSCPVNLGLQSTTGNILCDMK